MRKFTSLVAPLALILAVVFGASWLQAHTKLEKSEPAADATVSAPVKQVQIWFNEKLDAKVSKITLTGPAGAVKTGAVSVKEEKSIAASVDADTPNGKYTVAWQTAGGDGHVQKGEYSFTVTKKAQ